MSVTIAVGPGGDLMVDEIEAFAKVKTAPLHRAVRVARSNGMLLDFTYGNQVKTIILVKSGRIYLSPVTEATIRSRIEEAKANVKRSKKQSVSNSQQPES